MSAHTDKSIAEQAAGWQIRLKTATPEVRAEFDKWLRQSPQHVREMLFAEALDTELHDHFRRRRMDPQRRIDVQELLRSATNVREIGDAEPATALETAPRVARIYSIARVKGAVTSVRRTHWPVALAACFVALFAAATVAFHVTTDHGISTRAGEWQTRILDDGTIMRLGPRTKVDVDYSEQTRRIRLAQGEAMFHVAKNPARPFIVETEIASAVAIGTAFAVSRDDPRRVRVTVKEGIVAVARASDSRGGRTASTGPGRSVTLKAGDEVVITTAGLLATRHVDVDAVLAWARVQLSFENDPVKKVVAEYNRRNELQIKVADEDLLNRKITGTFDASDPKSFGLYLEKQGAVSVIDEESGTLTIAPYPAPITAEANN